MINRLGSSASVILGEGMDLAAAGLLARHCDRAVTVVLDSTGRYRVETRA